MQTGAVLRERYRIDALAGAGGMGTVFRALDLATGEPCAVKVLAPGASPHTRERFVREAAILANVSDPAIVRYIDHGSDPPFLVMEWVDGESLAERLRASGVKPSDALQLAARVVRGLAAVHAAGIVHRDLKPRNVMLPKGSFENAKIVDFGVARVQTEGRTNTGVRLGTPRYMAPEQIVSSRRVDGRADIFSVGCVLFEMLTGRRVFRGEDEVAVLARVVIEDAPRVRSIRADIPDALDDLVARLLARDVKRRPHASESLASELTDFVRAIETLPARDRASAEKDFITLDETPTDFALSTELTPLPPPSELPWATVGRDDECARLATMLAPGAIVGLWGSLGIGKSHVAQVVARRTWQTRGAIVCDLRGATNASVATERIGAELGLFHAASVEDVAVAVAGRGEIVIVLDSCDGAPMESIAIAKRVIDEAPSASVLVVSRERPNLPNAIELGPLDAASSVALLVARSRGAAEESRDRAALEAIAERLHHNALLLTLAASRASVLGMDAIAARLEHPLDMLGSAKTPSYPLPLRAALEGVWETLSSHERFVAACIALFPSAARPEIVSSMAGETDLDARPLDTLEALRDKSLLRPAPRATLVMDPTLRELVRSKFSELDTLAMSRARETFAREVITRATDDARRAREGGDALGDLVAFEPDVLAAFDVAASIDDAALVLAGALALEPSLVAHGPLDGIASILDRAVEACDALRESSPASLARLHAARGRVATLRGSFDVATESFEVASDFATRAKEPELVASVWLDAGVLHQARGDLAGAERCYAIVLDGHAGDASQAEARALGNLGALAHDRVDLDVAYTYYVRAIAVAESIGDARLLGVFLGNLAVLDRERGRTSDARQRFVRAVRVLEGARERRLVAMTLGNLGMVELEQGRVGAARVAFEQSAELLATFGDARSEALAQARFAAARAMEGDASAAEAALARGERLASHDARTLALVKFFRAFPESARAMKGDESSSAFAERVRARIASASALLQSDDDARGALRILERWAKSVV